MPYSESLYLCSFGGTLGDAEQEIWSCGIHLRLSGAFGATFDEDDYTLNQGGHIVEWLNRTTSHISFGTHLTFVKMNRLDTDGHYADPGNPHTRQYNVAGGSGASGLPFSSAVVLTWRTNSVAAGPASRGRIYSPYPNLTCDTSGTYPQAMAQDMANSAAILLDNLQVESGVGGDNFEIRPVIASKVGQGATHQIDYVVVDNRLDTQRRRSNSIVGVKKRSADIDY